MRLFCYKCVFTLSSTLLFTLVIQELTHVYNKYGKITPTTLSANFASMNNMRKLIDNKE